MNAELVQETADVDLLLSAWDMMQPATSTLMPRIDVINRRLMHMPVTHPMFNLLYHQMMAMRRIVRLRLTGAPAQAFNAITEAFHRDWDTAVFQMRTSLLERLSLVEDPQGQPLGVDAQQSPQLNEIIDAAIDLNAWDRQVDPIPIVESPPGPSSPVSIRAPWNHTESESESDEELPVGLPRVQRPHSAPPTYKESKRHTILETELGRSADHPMVRMVDEVPPYDPIEVEIHDLHMHPDGTMHINKLLMRTNHSVDPGSVVERLTTSLEHLFGLRRTRLPSVPE